MAEPRARFASPLAGASSVASRSRLPLGPTEERTRSPIGQAAAAMLVLFAIGAALAPYSMPLRAGAAGVLVLLAFVVARARADLLVRCARRAGRPRRRPPAFRRARRRSREPARVARVRVPRVGRARRDALSGDVGPSGRRRGRARLADAAGVARGARG